MLTGKRLGQAIEEARKLKRVTKKALAEHFEVKPPSIQDWVKYGTIDKAKLPDLWLFFADTVGPQHWGLERFPMALPKEIPAEGVSPSTVDACASTKAQPSLARAFKVVLQALENMPRQKRQAIASDWAALLLAPDSAELKTAVQAAIEGERSPNRREAA